MINTIFYFPESMEFDAYQEQVQNGTISPKTIVFAQRQGLIYKNGAKYTIAQEDMRQYVTQLLQSYLDNGYFKGDKGDLGDKGDKGDKGDTSIVAYDDTEIQERISDILDDLNTISDDIGRNARNISTIDRNVTNLDSKMISIVDHNTNTVTASSIKNILANDSGVWNDMKQAFATTVDGAAIVSSAKESIAQSFGEATWEEYLAYRTGNDAAIANTKSYVDGKKALINEFASFIGNDGVSATSIASKLANSTLAVNALAAKFVSTDNTKWALVLTTSDINTASSSLYAALHANDNTVVKKAEVIASINASTEESNVTINADRINLNGTVIAQRLLAANAVIGGFTIGQNELSAGDSLNYISLSPSSGFYASSSEMVGGVGPTNSIRLDADGLKTETFGTLGGTTTNQINIDGSGSLASGSLYWDTEGTLTIGNVIGDVKVTNFDGTYQTLIKDQSISMDGSVFFYYVNTVDGIKELKGSVVGTNSGLMIGLDDAANDYITLNGRVVGTSFAVSGGTSSQFLKANGSVDDTSYLPLTGGTMTGTLAIDGSLMNGAYVLDVDGVARVRDNMTVGGSFTINDSSYGYSDISVDSTGLCINTSQIRGTKQLHLLGAATITSSCTADSFIKSGGTSSEILMADGSTMTLAELKAALAAI